MAEPNLQSSDVDYLRARLRELYPEVNRFRIQVQRHVASQVPIEDDIDSLKAQILLCEMEISALETELSSTKTDLAMTMFDLAMIKGRRGPLQYYGPNHVHSAVC